MTTNDQACERDRHHGGNLSAGRVSQESENARALRAAGFPPVVHRLPRTPRWWQFWKGRG